MKTQFSFSQAIDGYMLHAMARRLSQHTLLDYSNTFRKFQDFLDDDPPLRVIQPSQIE